MTSEGSEPEATEPSENASGDHREPRASERAADDEEAAETRAGSDATREERAADDEEPSEQRAATNGSRERNEPEATDDSKEVEGSEDETSPDDGGVPLDITGHEDRRAERESETEAESESTSTSEKQNGTGPGVDELSNGDSAASAGAGSASGERIDGESLVTEAPVDPAADPEDDEVEPVELLVQLAKEGEIEPWDIDIVAVTDKFLDALDEADLRTSGRALFYASVLLRMKSDVMLEEDDEEPEDDLEDRPPWEAPPAEEEGGSAYDPVNALEAEMDRRLDRKHARGNPETLDELVRDLRDAERGSWWKESREYDTSNSPTGFRRGVQELNYHSGDEFRMDDEPTAEDALGNAHQEDIEATIEDVRAVLDEQYGAGRTEVLYEEVADSGGSRVKTFLALLFLAHRGAITLEQDELFGDLWVCDTTPAAAERVVTAD